MNERSYFGVGGSRVDGHDEMRVGLVVVSRGAVVLMSWVNENEPELRFFNM
jgi:hypothetical protein